VMCFAWQEEESSGEFVFPGKTRDAGKSGTGSSKGASGSRMASRGGEG
jgi:hypothetical protein